MPSPQLFLQAAIFDVYGVLIDSEPFWRESEIEIFSRCGLRLTEAECMLTAGMRIQEVTRDWYERKPWKDPSTDELAKDILQGVIGLVRERGAPMPGLYDALRLFQSLNLRLALASSSALSLIDVIVDHLKIRPYFGVICSAENELRGKPHPDVYLTAAARLGLPPERCLAIEDSIAGVAAAKAAGMECIAIPLPELRGDPRYQAADAVVDLLSQIDENILARLGMQPGERLLFPTYILITDCGKTFDHWERTPHISLRRFPAPSHSPHFPKENGGMKRDRESDWARFANTHIDFFPTQ